MSELIKGKTWYFGDNIDTDVLAPGSYMKLPIEQAAEHCLEAIDSQFAKEVKTGDLIVAGDAFGIGSSREQAAQALVVLGIKAIVAKSFARIFYRNALNLGLPVLECPEIEADKGDVLVIDAVNGKIENQTKGLSWQCAPIPPQLIEIVNAGGLMPFLKNKFKQPV